MKRPYPVRFLSMLRTLSLLLGLIWVAPATEAEAVSGINALSCSGSVTVMDGIYPVYTTNHTGPYAALQLDMSATNGYGYYTP